MLGLKREKKGLAHSLVFETYKTSKKLSILVEFFSHFVNIGKRYASVYAYMHSCKTYFIRDTTFNTPF